MYNDMWNFIWEHGHEVAGFLTLLAVIIRWVSWPVNKILEASKARDAIIKKHGEQLTLIEKEVKHNDGSSLKDALKRIEAETKKQTPIIRRSTVRIGKLEKMHGSIMKKLGEFETTKQGNVRRAS